MRPAASMTTPMCTHWERRHITCVQASPPFVGRPLEGARAHASQAPIRLRQRAPQVSAAVASLVMSMLAKQPAGHAQRGVSP